MVHQGRIASSFLFVGLFMAHSITLKGQSVELDRYLSNELITPILREISAFTRTDKNDYAHCSLKFLSLAFIIDSESFNCDTIKYSNTVSKDLRLQIDKLFKNRSLNWNLIVNNRCLKRSGNIKVIIAIYLSQDKCPSKKIDESNAWEVFSDLLMVSDESLEDIVILPLVKSHISNN
jgi:hypothetical protein